MATNIYGAIALTGVDGSVDSIDGTDLADKDICIAVVLGTGTYTYALDEDSGLTESFPGTIAPNTNAGLKRWILQSFIEV